MSKSCLELLNEMFKDFHKWYLKRSPGATMKEVEIAFLSDINEQYKDRPGIKDRTDLINKKYL